MNSWITRRKPELGSQMDWLWILVKAEHKWKLHYIPSRGDFERQWWEKKSLQWQEPHLAHLITHLCGRRNGPRSKWCWKSVPSCAKEWNWTTILHHIQNLNGLNVWPEIKLLEGNIGSKVLNIGCGSHILDLTIKDKEVGVQTEKLLHSKRNHQQMKR